MSGHTAGRTRKWPWAVSFVLFALTFAWSYGLMGERVGGVWNLLRIGSAVGLSISLLALALSFMSSRRLRRAQAQGDETAETWAEGQAAEEQPPAEEGPRTYEEVFGLQSDLDAGSLPASPEGEEWLGDSGTADIEAESEASAEQLPAEEHDSTTEDDVQSVQADLEEGVDQVEAPDADGSDADGSQDHLRRMREEFRARAEEAALRVKQREAELQETASVADQER